MKNITPLPDHLPPIPDGYGYLGKGKEFVIHDGKKFDGYYHDDNTSHQGWLRGDWNKVKGTDARCYYLANLESDIWKINNPEKKELPTPPPGYRLIGEEEKRTLRFFKGFVCSPDSKKWIRFESYNPPFRQDLHYCCSELPTILQPTTPTEVNTSKYSYIPVATPTLVYGEDVSQMTEGQIITAIQSNQESIAELQALKTPSKRIAKRIKDHELAIEKLTEELDKIED